MKKLLLNYRVTLPVSLLVVLFVACGLKFTSIEIDNHSPEQGTDITITAKMVSEADNNGTDLYHLLAVRVPEDWTSVGAIGYPDSEEITEESTKYTMVESAPYAAFCEFCFPREGYKWIAFQTSEQYQQGNNAIVNAQLTVGEEMGEYNIDIIVGGWSKNPDLLVKEDGEVDLALAFGNNTNFDTAIMPDDKTYYNSSEYLMIAGTISDAEYEDRKTFIASKYTGDYYGNGVKPVCPEIVNRNTTQNLKVEVVEFSGIDEVVFDENGEAEYFNLQGVRVMNPENGLYIKVQGGKATKVYLK